MDPPGISAAVSDQNSSFVPHIPTVECGCRRECGTTDDAANLENGRGIASTRERREGLFGAPPSAA